MKRKNRLLLTILFLLNTGIVNAVTQNNILAANFDLIIRLLDMLLGFIKNLLYTDSSRILITYIAIFVIIYRSLKTAVGRTPLKENSNQIAVSFAALSCIAIFYKVGDKIKGLSWVFIIFGIFALFFPLISKFLTLFGGHANRVKNFKKEQRSEKKVEKVAKQEKKINKKILKDLNHLKHDTELERKYEHHELKDAKKIEKYNKLLKEYIIEIKKTFFKLQNEYRNNGNNIKDLLEDYNNIKGMIIKIIEKIEERYEDYHESEIKEFKALHDEVTRIKDAYEKTNNKSNNNISSIRSKISDLDNNERIKKNIHEQKNLNIYIINLLKNINDIDKNLEILIRNESNNVEHMKNVLEQIDKEISHSNHVHFTNQASILTDHLSRSINNLKQVLYNKNQFQENKENKEEYISKIKNTMESLYKKFKEYLEKIEDNTDTLKGAADILKNKPQ